MAYNSSLWIGIARVMAADGSLVYVIIEGYASQVENEYYILEEISAGRAT